MEAEQARLLDPDKFGLLIQCRQKMDQLNSSQLRQYAQSLFSLLSVEQLKKLLFVGFNSMRNDLKYKQIFEMKTSINEIIEEINKKKKAKQKQQTQQKHKSIPIIPKNASLTKVIPSDIISNNICTYLKMSSITNLAECDRQLTVICHTPTSINNLMHRYDPYKYNTLMRGDEPLIDGHYHNMDKWNPSNMHRFKNVEQLSISLEYFDCNSSYFTMFNKVKHISFYEGPGAFFSYSYPYNISSMALLESIAFVSIYNTEILSEILQSFAPNTHSFKSISFVDCVIDLNDGLSVKQYKSILDSMLPSVDRNNLQVLKMEDSNFFQTNYAGYNECFEDMDRIRSSLRNLNGFVYAQHHAEDHNFNLFTNLATNILNDLSSFNKLQSIHTHSIKPQLLLSYLNRNNMTALQQIKELCISVPFKQEAQSPLLCLNSFLPKLERLCIVIRVSDQDKTKASSLENIISKILQTQIKLKVFQMVFVMHEQKKIRDETDRGFCSKRIAILSEFIKHLIHSLSTKRNPSQSLVFRLHIKSIHNCTKLRPHCEPKRTIRATLANRMQHLFLNYLIAYPSGKIQIKLSDNVTYHQLISNTAYLYGLKGLFRINISQREHIYNDEKYIHNDIDFKQYAISASKKDIDENTEYEVKWNVDCRYCCNTSWF